MEHPQTTSALVRQIRKQFIMLTIQFLLGMGVNLIGLPGEVSSRPVKIADSVILILHVLVAIGLIINGVVIARMAARQGRNLKRLSAGASAALGTALLSGVLTMVAPLSNWWSFLMAASFIVAFLLYGKLYVQAKTATPAQA